MNNHTDENIAFFLVEIKLYQIGSSDIAVKFEVVEKPNDWTKEIKRNTSNSPTLQARYDYWVAFNASMEAGFVEEGDLVVITAGIPVGLSGTTNLIKVHTIGKVLLTGTGIGNRVGAGRVVIGNSEEELLSKFEDGDVLVCRATYRDMVKFIERASAVIAEEGGLTSHCAIVGLNLNKATVVGAANATQLLKEGDIVTVDGVTGQVYKGEEKVL